MIRAVGLALSLLVTATTAYADDATPVCTTPTRACYIRTAQAYFAAILDGQGAAVPFASDVRVTEQGNLVAASRADFLSQFKTTGVTKRLRNMRIIVDTTKGEVAVLVLADARPDNEPPYTVRRIQRMKIVGGLIHEVEIVIYKDDHADSLWPDVSATPEKGE